MQQIDQSLPYQVELDRDEVEALRRTILSKLTYVIGKDPQSAREHDWFVAAAFAVRDRIVDRWMQSTRRTYVEKRKRIYYLSVEFLIGRLLFDALGNLNLIETMRSALAGLGVDLDALQMLEPDAALGNGGLGRLAACFMDSMASLSMPAYGYGIRYEHGLFQQGITDGWQREYPEDWLSTVNPWEFERPEVSYRIKFGGSVDPGVDEPTERGIWHPAETVLAVAHDTPVPGWRGKHVNTLRLWSARAIDPLHLHIFNEGDHVGAMSSRTMAESITRVLYPSDSTPSGQELRLRQEFFFTSASLQDLIRRHLQQYGQIRSLPDHSVIQLNDTHPAIAVAELMRLLVDEHDCTWQDAWRITRETLNYTNHTLMPEALERWPLMLMHRLLPRHLQIIYRINSLHLQEARERQPNETRFLASVSLIDESEGRHVRMGHLAFVGSGKINGVSALHSELLRRTAFRDLDSLYPGRIVNKTNGITFRRWLYGANPGLTALLVEVCGERVLDDPELSLPKFERFADDASLLTRLKTVRRENKDRLIKLTADRLGVQLDPHAMFDVQIKRIHDYKRQLLNIIETVALYNAIRAEPNAAWAPRVKVFAGKAAASYTRAKLIIKLINDVANVINNDPAVRDLLKVVFLPNYNVTLAQMIVPAADLSEQISTAGMEASGTGNMKLALNGALTIGTLDGANVEIREHVGADNIIIFGMTSEEVAEHWRKGFLGQEAIDASPILQSAIDSISSGRFSPDDRERFRSLTSELFGPDRFMLAADFASYWEAQRKLDALWLNPSSWWRMSVFNTANMGWFSSDRTIREYAEEIWRVPAAGGP